MNGLGHSHRQPLERTRAGAITVASGSFRTIARGLERGGCYTRARDHRINVGAPEQIAADHLSVRVADALLVRSVHGAVRGTVWHGGVTRDDRREPDAESGRSGRTGLSSHLHALRDDRRLLRDVSGRVRGTSRDHPRALGDGWWRVHRPRSEAPQPERERPRSTPSGLSDPPAPADSSGPRFATDLSCVGEAS